MSFEIAEPVLVIGLGGAGSKLAVELKQVMNSDCICISNDKTDLNDENSIEISTKSIINPSIQLIRGCALEHTDEIGKCVSNYKTVIIMANLAGKAGAALSPIVSSICKRKTKTYCHLPLCHLNFKKTEFSNLVYH